MLLSKWGCIVVQQKPNKAPLISVVVPCFNEEKVLAQFVERMSAACIAVAGNSYEIIIVDDGSQDATFALAQSLSNRADVIAARLPRNFGHQIAATTGLAMARGSYVLLIDADLQDPPELLARMFVLIKKGADVVYGRRIRREGETKFKKLTAALFYRFLSRLSSVPIPQDTGDFRLMRRHVVELLVMMPEQQRFLRGMVSWLGGNQVPFPYVRDRRFAGSTKYSLTKMLAFAADAITSFSTRPLRVASHVALFSGCLAVLLFGYSVFRWLEDGTIPGWTSLMAALSMFSCLQFLVLGVIGEYIGRIFIEVKRRPLFLVDSISANGQSYRPPSDFGLMAHAERLKIMDGFARARVPIIWSGIDA
jgi:dolichol-phosphate mannosyltransferase